MTVHPHSETGDDAHNPLDSFTDREDILTLFRRILRSAQAGHLHLVAIKGNSGTGKTFLISYLLERVCPLFPWQAGAMSFAQSTPDFRTILLGLELLPTLSPLYSTTSLRAPSSPSSRL